MKCGNCGLVHPPLEQVCRRCEIDMKTGERRARTEAYAGAKARTGGTRLRKVPARDPGGPAAAESVPETRESRRREPRKSAGQAEAPATRKPGKPGLGSFIIQSPAKGEISSLSCLQCEGDMEIKIKAPFSRSWPVILIVVGVMVFFAGLAAKSYLAWIMTAASVAAGIFYLRVGKTYWKCDSCGHVINRE